MPLTDWDGQGSDVRTTGLELREFTHATPELQAQPSRTPRGLPKQGVVDEVPEGVVDGLGNHSNAKVRVHRVRPSPRSLHVDLALLLLGPTEKILDLIVHVMKVQHTSVVDC